MGSIRSSKISNMKNIIFILILSVSCRPVENHMIVLTDLKPYILKEKHTSVVLLESFLNTKRCESSDGIYYADAFLCKTLNSNDTILVFSICEQTFEFLKSSYKDERDLIIDSASIKRMYPPVLSVTFDVRDYERPYSFLVARINKLEY